MFKKFVPEESMSGSSLVKTSVQRAIKKKVLELYPTLGEEIDVLFPKKVSVHVVKCKDHVSLVVVAGVPLFWSLRENEYFPTLRVLHRYPDMLPHVGVDKGAIKFVLQGAQVMCPGLTSPGGRLDVPVAVDKPVAIHAEGKVHALAIGTTKMSTDDIKRINQGIALNTLTVLGDGLWLCPTIDVKGPINKDKGEEKS